MPQWGVATGAKGSRHVAASGCRGTGRISAHEAQCTGVAVTLAEVSPNPPWLNGKCAMASEVAGMAPASRSSERQAATAAAWSSPRVRFNIWRSRTF